MVFGSTLTSNNCYSSNVPILNTSDVDVFELTGFMYKTYPEWYDATGVKLMHTRFDVNHKSLLHRWFFPESAQSVYYLSTSDDVMPTIVDLKQGVKMNVARVNIINGYTTWRVTR